MSADLATTRILVFDQYYAEAGPEEQEDLKTLLAFVMESMRKRCKSFGPNMAKELIMALIEFKDHQPGGCHVTRRS